MASLDNQAATSPAAASAQRQLAPEQQNHERGESDRQQGRESTTMSQAITTAGEDESAVPGCTPELYRAFIDQFGEAEGTTIAQLVANEQLGSHLALQMLSKTEMRELLSWGNFDESYVDRMRAALATARDRYRMSEAGERVCGRAAMFCGLSPNSAYKPQAGSFFKSLNIHNPFK